MSKSKPTLSFNLPHRPYDRFLSPMALEKAKKLRISPSGGCHRISLTLRGGKTVALYPWDKLLLGDFFLAPIGGKSIESMRIGFLKAAARHDFELTMVKVAIAVGTDAHDKTDFLQVTVSAIGVNWAKERAYLEGYTSRPPSRSTVDSRREAKAESARERRLVERAKPKSAPAKRRKPVPPLKSTPPVAPPLKSTPPVAPPVETTDRLKSQAVIDQMVEKHEQHMAEQGYRPGMTKEEKRAFALRKR